MNPGSQVNHLMGFQVEHPGVDVLHVYSNLNLDMDGAGGRFRS